MQRFYTNLLRQASYLLLLFTILLIVTIIEVINFQNDYSISYGLEAFLVLSSLLILLLFIIINSVKNKNFITHYSIVFGSIILLIGVYLFFFYNNDFTFYNSSDFLYETQYNFPFKVSITIFEKKDIIKETIVKQYNYLYFNLFIVIIGFIASFILCIINLFKKVEK